MNNRLRLAVLLSSFLLISTAAAMPTHPRHHPQSMTATTARHQGHKKWMVTLQQMHMDMLKMRDGTNDLTSAEVFARGFTVAPINMTTQITMLSVMYMANNHFAFMAMAPYIKRAMNHVTRTGINFRTTAEGLGDVKLKTFYTLLKNMQQQLTLGLGVSLPNGSINKRDRVPTGFALLPYPMQLGSGTTDVLPCAEYALTFPHQWSLDLNGYAVLHMGKNNHQYALGNAYSLSAKLAKQFTHWLQMYTRIKGMDWGNIRGADPQQNPNVAPTGNPSMQAGKRVNVTLGIALKAPAGLLKGQKLTIEAKTPIYQRLTGPQMALGWGIGFAWVIPLG